MKTHLILLHLLCVFTACSQNKTHSEMKEKAENYYYGRKGVVKNYQKAAHWFLKAAQKGDSEAQFRLGWMYHWGYIRQDDTKAVFWWQKSAAQGNPEAQYDLGIMYYNGLGTAQNYKKALNWIRKSASQKYPIAQYFLGRTYYAGQGVEKDSKKAKYWYQKACKNGHSYACERLEN